MGLLPPPVGAVGGAEPAVAEQGPPGAAASKPDRDEPGREESAQPLVALDPFAALLAQRLQAPPAKREGSPGEGPLGQVPAAGGNRLPLEPGAAEGDGEAPVALAGSPAGSRGEAPGAAPVRPGRGAGAPSSGDSAGVVRQRPGPEAGPAGGRDAPPDSARGEAANVEREPLTAATSTEDSGSPRQRAAAGGEADPRASSPDLLPGTPPARAHPTPAAPTDAAATRTLSVPARIDDPGWGEGFAQRVRWLAGERVQAAVIQIEPPELGPIEIRIALADEHIRLTLTARHVATREAIDASLPRLREVFSASGLTLAEATVSGGDGGGAQRDPGSGAGGAAPLAQPFAEGEDEPCGYGRASGRSGLLDHYA